MLDESIYIRMDTALKEKLEKLAAADERSTSAYIRRVLKDHVDGGMVIKNAGLTKVKGTVTPIEIRQKRTKPLAAHDAQNNTPPSDDTKFCKHGQPVGFCKFGCKS